MSSLVEKWLRGGTCSTTDAANPSRMVVAQGRPVFTSTATTKEALVMELNHKLNSGDHYYQDTDLWTLTVREIRLLLSSDSTTASTTKEAHGIVAAVVEPSPTDESSKQEAKAEEEQEECPSSPPSALALERQVTFSAWDFTSFFDEPLSLDEVQAITIAMAAEAQEEFQSYDDDDTQSQVPTPTDTQQTKPKRLSLASRHASVETILSNAEYTELLVTLGLTATTTTTAGRDKDTVLLEEKNAPDNTIPTTMSATTLRRPIPLATRQVSIPRPSHIDGRPASVQVVTSNTTTNSKSQPAQFIVKFGGTSHNNNAANKEPKSTTTTGVVDRPATVVTKQVSIQPQPAISIDPVVGTATVSIPARIDNHTPTCLPPNGLRTCMSVRLNGNDLTRSTFQVVL